MGVVCVVIGELDSGSAESPGLVKGQAGGLNTARGGNARLLGASCTRSDAQERCAGHRELGEGAEKSGEVLVAMVCVDFSTTCLLAVVRKEVAACPGPRHLDLWPRLTLSGHIS